MFPVTAGAGDIEANYSNHRKNRHNYPNPGITSSFGALYSLHVCCRSVHLLWRWSWICFPGW
uniref:Candidate secreted effector n=1 Tax=Meloidogyne incognita TaxID=6306 RepID=A0A914MHN8_MELIC